MSWDDRTPFPRTSVSAGLWNKGIFFIAALDPQSVEGILYFAKDYHPLDKRRRLRVCKIQDPFRLQPLRKKGLEED